MKRTKYGRCVTCGTALNKGGWCRNPNQWVMHAAGMLPNSRIKRRTK